MIKYALYALMAAFAVWLSCGSMAEACDLYAAQYKPLREESDPLGIDRAKHDFSYRLHFEKPVGSSAFKEADAVAVLDGHYNKTNQKAFQFRLLHNCTKTGPSRFKGCGLFLPDGLFRRARILPMNRDYSEAPALTTGPAPDVILTGKLGYSFHYAFKLRNIRHSDENRKETAPYMTNYIREEYEAGRDLRGDIPVINENVWVMDKCGDKDVTVTPEPPTSPACDEFSYPVYSPHPAYGQGELAFEMTMHPPPPDSFMRGDTHYVVARDDTGRVLSSYSSPIGYSQGSGGSWLMGAKFLELDRDMQEHHYKDERPFYALILYGADLDEDDFIPPEDKDNPHSAYYGVAYNTKDRVRPDFSGKYVWVLKECRPIGRMPLAGSYIQHGDELDLTVDVTQKLDIKMRDNGNAEITFAVNGTVNSDTKLSCNIQAEAEPTKTSWSARIPAKDNGSGKCRIHIKANDEIVGLVFDTRNLGACQSYCNEHYKLYSQYRFDRDERRPYMTMPGNGSNR